MFIAEIMAGFALTIILGIFVWESTNMVEEKKQRRRKGLTDYYDNPIGKNDE